MKTTILSLAFALLPVTLLASDKVPGWSLPGDTPEKIADPAAMTQQGRISCAAPLTGVQAERIIREGVKTSLAKARWREQVSGSSINRK